jgi:hypothetical protein
MEKSKDTFGNTKHMKLIFFAGSGGMSMDSKGNIYEETTDGVFKDIVTDKKFTSQDFSKALKRIQEVERLQVMAMNVDERIAWYNAKSEAPTQL